MNQDRFQRVMEMFERASTLPAQARRAFLEEHLADDPSARAEVEELLNHHDREGAVATGVGLRAAEGVWAAELVAAPVLRGDYRILRTIGEGGMGVVFEAEQAYPRRRVALKALRPRFASRGMVRRFRNEVDFLARLQHPGIAQIYEAGVADEASPDQAYFVMELIDGAPLTEYARFRGLDLRARWGLILRTCEAVQHAHQRGVIHRDLKPANILVTRDGAPKIVDFGVARAAQTEHRGTAATLEGQLVGTPSYMSPEQMRGGEVDTRSDIYALGVITYELLTGRLPFDLSSTPIAEAARTVCEVDPPPLSSRDRELRGDQEVIVAKAMAKEPDRRYSSASELADDIRRYLAGEAITARRDSAVYIIGKQLRRHRILAAAIVAAFLGLVAFGIFAAASARTQSRLAADALAAKADADRAADRVKQELFHANIERARLEASLGNLLFAEDVLWRAAIEDPTSEAPRWALWELYEKSRSLWVTQAPRFPARTASGGGLLVFAAGDGRLTVMRTADGQTLGQTAPLGGQPTAVAVSPDASWAIVGTARGAVAIVDLKDGGVPREVMPATDPPRAVRAAAVSPDGTIMAYGLAGSVVRVCAVADGRLIHELPFASVLTSLVFSRDGALLAMGGEFPGVGVSAWDLRTGSKAFDWTDLQPSHLLSMAFSPDGQTLLCGFRDGSLTALPLGDGEPRSFAVPANGGLANVSFSPDGKRILASMSERPIVLDAATGVSTVYPRLSDFLSAAVWVDERTFAGATPDGAVRCFATDEAPISARMAGFASWCHSAAYSPDGALLAVGGGDSSIRVFDATTHAQVSIFTIDKPVHRTRGLKFLPDSRTLLCGSQDGIVRFMDARTGEITSSIRAGASEIFAIDVSAGRLCVGFADRTASLWDLETREKIGDLPRGEKRIESVAFSSDGRTLATSSLSQGVQLWSIASLASAGVLECSAQPWGVRWSPDDRRLYVTTWSGAVDVFSLGPGRTRQTLKGHQRLAPALAVSADGRMFASGGEEGVLKVWDAESLRNILSLEPNTASIVGLAFRPDSQRLLAACSLRAAVEYDLAAGEARARNHRAYYETKLGRR